MSGVIEMKRPERILIIKMSAIGDVVHTLPLLEVLGKNFPGTRIDWLVEEEASDIIAGHPFLDRMIVSRRKGWEKRLAGFRDGPAVLREGFAFLKELRARRYDLILDLQGLLRSGVLTGLSRGKRKIGLEGAREGGGLFVNDGPVPVDPDEHAVDRYLRMAAYLGCRPVPWKGEIALFDADRERVERLLNGNAMSGRPLVAVNPMARWETKLWPPERFTALAARLTDELGCGVVFTGSRRDRAVLDGVCAGAGDRAVNLAGRTDLKQLACLYTRCAVVVTTDTGPMHIAAAMGTPVVALFGPTAPWRTGPYGKGHTIIREKMPCSPCFKKRCDHGTCMDRIAVDRVFSAVREALGAGVTAGERG
ncbi:MAG: lipopolysaccharide heptosyltransferase II [Deltaproteobacteria bacterium]|nr:MAG: lipopolysaccharide heptosyltransferase II [Deltaproteobacteria bacterium]